MVANIRGYTPNYGLKLINFDTPRWHTLEYSNWELVDAIMASTGLPGLRGEWINSTTYVVGERVFDAADGKIYGCLVSHTSAATGTFAADRIAHPDYWMLQTLDTPRYRGGWAPSVAYSVADIVFINSYTYYICIANHTSSTTFPPDAPKWSLVFDATAAVNTTNANAVAAAGSATNAATSASQAATSATNSQNSAVESAAQAAKLFGTSTSSVVVGLGGKTFITQASKYFNVGKFIMVRADSDPVNQWMWGQVTSYSGTSLVINAITSGGSGTYAAWTIDVSGSRGAIGPQGIQGELGPPLVIKGTVPSAAALPPSGNTIGDMYIAEDNQHLYIWDGAQWDDAGPLGTSTTTTADVPPSNPKDGDMWFETDTGIFWVYYTDINSSQWVQAGGTAASINQNFVLKTGDTMAGDLTIDKADATIVLNKKAGGQLTRINALTANAPRWSMQMGNATPETGSDTGSNFVLYRFSDAGAFNAAMTIDRATGAMTLTGDLTISKATNPTIVLNKTATASNEIYGRMNGLNRWRIKLGSEGVETGGNQGSDLSVTAYDDAGNQLGGTAIQMLRNASKMLINWDTQINTATPSTSPGTGALIVGGGLGVGGGINTYNKILVNTISDSPPFQQIQGAAITELGQVKVRSLGGTAAIECASASNGNVINFFSSTAAVVGTIVTSTTATAYNTASDASLKEDLKSFDAGSIIDNTEVYDFAWKSTKERNFGIIAQQAVEVYPQAITHTEASTEKGAERDEWWGVDYSKYVPVLLQELKALRARVAELEGKTPEAPKRKR